MVSNSPRSVANCDGIYSTRYRELVGTAETIVSMSRSMEDVDTTLGDIGRRCNPRLIGKKYTHLNQINGETTDKGMCGFWIEGTIGVVS